MTRRPPAHTGTAVLILAALITYALAVIVIPFSQNHLQVADFPGHLQAAAYVRDVLFPSPTGWDYRFFGGYPLNQFYAPLPAWLTALLGFAIPLDVALKALLSLAILSTPLSIYYCARRWSFARLPAATLTVLIFALLAIRNETFLGMDFTSVFHFGFYTTGLATPLLFLYIGRLRRDAQAGDYLVATLLLALVSVTHLYVGLAAWLFLAAYVLAEGVPHGLLTRHACRAALLVSFMVVPLVAKIGYSASRSGAIEPITLHVGAAAILLLGGLSAIYLARRRDAELAPLMAYFALLLLVFIVGTAAHLPFQAYRALLPALAFGLFFPLRILASRPRVLIAPACIGGLLLIFSLGAIDYRGPEPIALPDFGHVDGRIMVTYYAPSWHVLSELIPATTGNLVARGLYIESAPNGQFYRHIEADLNSHLHDPLLDRSLRFFGINWLLANDTFGVPYTERRPVTAYQGAEVSLFRIANASLAEVLTRTPPRVQGGWRQAAQAWATSPDAATPVVLGPDELPPAIGTGEERVEITEISHRRIRVRVDTPEPVPVLLKFTYFPNWRAFVDGAPTRIHQVLPAFMLVYGHGDIELRYTTLPVDILGWLLSAIGAAWLAFEALARPTAYLNKGMRRP